MPKYPGGTTTVTAEFRDALGALADPTAVLLRIREPDGTTTTYTYGAPGSPITKTSLGKFAALITHGTPGTAGYSGLWGWEWEGTGAVAAVDDGTFYVEQPLGVNRLVSLDDVKTARRGMPAVLDDLIDALIVRASAAIYTLSGRKFAIDAVATERVYPISGCHAFIDDLSANPAAGKIKVWGPWATTATSTLVSTTDYRVWPRNREPFEPITALELVRYWSSDYEVRIEGVWGFPAIPEDIREATIDTVVEWLKSDQAITVQSPEQFEPGAPPERGLPLKARDLCRAYRRPLLAIRR